MLLARLDRPSVYCHYPQHMYGGCALPLDRPTENAEK